MNDYPEIRASLVKFSRGKDHPLKAHAEVLITIIDAMGKEPNDPDLKDAFVKAYQRFYLAASGELLPPMTDETIPVNLPFSRVPVCACDTGEEPPSKQKQMECRLLGGPCSPNHVESDAERFPAATVEQLLEENERLRSALESGQQVLVTEGQAGRALMAVMSWYAESPIREIQMANDTCGIQFPLREIEAALRETSVMLGSVGK